MNDSCLFLNWKTQLIFFQIPIFIQLLWEMLINLRFDKKSDLAWMRELQIFSAGSARKYQRKANLWKNCIWMCPIWETANIQQKRQLERNQFNANRLWISDQNFANLFTESDFLSPTQHISGQTEIFKEPKLSRFQRVARQLDKLRNALMSVGSQERSWKLTLS